MMILNDKKSIIGESPIWNDTDKKLYVTNGMQNEILIYDILTNTSEVRKTPIACAAICFDCNNHMIVSYANGVAILNDDDTISPIYDETSVKISNANDMKVGPDGRIYVGTQSSKRIGISGKIDGKLYCIDKGGNVSVLLDGLMLSNGLDWSDDEKFMYHTDSDTEIIKEYSYDKAVGSICFSGREIKVPGVDGFTVAENGDIYAAGWGTGRVFVIETQFMRIKDVIEVPVNTPVSCGFVGRNSEYLAVTSATYGIKNETNTFDGATLLLDVGKIGRRPYIFGKNYR